MDRQVFLHKNNSVFSTNQSNSLSVDLSVKQKLLAENNASLDFSLFEQYNKERDACEKYRFIFKVNPFCTNVLFNTQTEIVYKEGTDDAMAIRDVTSLNPSTINNGDNHIQNSTIINRKQAIRDTEYSHKDNGDFIYHCGIDMFNNHQLRNNGFVHINKISPSNGQLVSANKKVYNTIKDFLRDGEGMVVKSYVNPRFDAQKVPLHLYLTDTIKTMKTAYTEGLKENDGWLGFYNKGNIDIPNSQSELTKINTILSNRKQCEFIDLYPDRTLFSFVPKYNDNRKRLEKNWDYCITYPYLKDYDLVDTICSGHSQAIRCAVEYSISPAGSQVVLCSSLFKHSLEDGDTINIYYYKRIGNNQYQFTLFSRNVRVYYTGDINGENKESKFALKVEDVESILDDIIAKGLFYKKVVNGEECEYYFRKYKKLLGFNENGVRNKELRSDIGKAAFGETIYGDSTAQIIFTDDIDISNLKDHHGRPLTDVYFTVVKRNAGHNEWYYQHNYGDSKVEYSHCFGPVSSGIKVYGNDDINFNYNINKLHNITNISLGVDYSQAYNVLGDMVLSGVPKTIDQNITITNTTYYGNLVEFDKTNYEETELSPVFYRFNTMQREFNRNTEYAELFHDEIDSDDFDFNGSNNATFTVNEKNYAHYINDGHTYKIMANLRPEGYYYNPHTRIVLRKENDLVKSVKAKYLNFGSISGTFFTDVYKTVVKMVVPSSYGLLKRQPIAIYDKGVEWFHSRVSWGEISSINGQTIEVDFIGCPFDNMPYIPGLPVDITNLLNQQIDGKPRFMPFYSTEGVPSYAEFVKSNLTFVWRGIDKMSELDSGDELYNQPFANGRHYVEKTINFFVKRQDPTGSFGLQYAKNPIHNNPMEMFNINGNEFDISEVLEFYNKLNNVCY